MNEPLDPNTESTVTLRAGEWQVIVNAVESAYTYAQVKDFVPRLVKAVVDGVKKPEPEPVEVSE